MDLKTTRLSKYYIQFSNETDQRVRLLICIRESPGSNFDQSICHAILGGFSIFCQVVGECFQVGSDASVRMRLLPFAFVDWLLEIKHWWTLIALCIMTANVCSSSTSQRKVETKQEYRKLLAVLLKQNFLRNLRLNPSHCNHSNREMKQAYCQI